MDLELFAGEIFDMLDSMDAIDWCCDHTSNEIIEAITELLEDFGVCLS